MYFYISFLRAPLLQARPSPAHPLDIKVQITNDLRTEFYDKEADIFYAWTRFGDPNSAPTSTPFTKLTTWRQSNTYTELKVYPPKNVTEGQRLQLVLCSPGQTRGQGVLSAIDLSVDETSTAVRPFPVLSLPILFSSKPQREKQGEKQGEKQEQIQRLIKLPPTTVSTEGTQQPKACILHFVEHLAFDLDKKLWDSGIGLSRWLAQLMVPESGAQESVRKKELLSTLACAEINILELGSGTGIVSTVLATLLSQQRMASLASASNSGSGSSNGVVRIIATDLPSAMPVLERNIALNKHTFNGDVSVSACVLDWNEDLPHTCTQNRMDLIIMADVTYNTASFPALITTLKRLSNIKHQRSSDNATNSPSLSPAPDVPSLRNDRPLVLLAYKERDSAERSLWDMACSVGLVFGEVDRVCGAGGAPVEIYLGRFTREA